MKRGIKRNFLESKKALSPVIATVLLVMMVVVIASIIFIWFQGMTQESITKFDNKNIKRACGEVEFGAEYYGGVITISNSGEIPIFGMQIKLSETGGDYETKNLGQEYPSWGLGLNSGEIFSEDISSLVGTNAEKLVLIPVLIGSSDNGEKTHKCEENQQGYEIIL